jgi:hypothetical protein
LLQLESVTASSQQHAPSGPPSPSKTPPPASSAPEATNATQAAGTFLTVAAHLKRLSLLVSARTAEEFWPPSEVTSQRTERRSLSVSHSTSLHGRRHSLLLSTPNREVVTVGDERPLVTLVSEGGLMRYAQVRVWLGNHA